MAITHFDIYKDWVVPLSEGGIIPPETRRIIIDVGMEQIVKVYYECNADERMFTIELADALKGADVISVGDCDGPG
jgi:hypothetical protein